MRLKHILTLAMAALVLTCGCTPTITKSALDKRTLKAAESTPPGQAYYTGSDDENDYFAIRGGQQDRIRLVAVPRIEGAMANRFIVTSDEAGWRPYSAPGMAGTNDLTDAPD